jgi:hypothetical protein
MRILKLVSADLQQSFTDCLKRAWNPVERSF